MSADRAGLVCCGGIEIAATAIFKTICGLSIPGLKVDPRELAQQWEHLVDEVLEDGRRDQWQLSHPFPPLRMKALLSFWQHGPGPLADGEVQRLLALMEPSSAQKKDDDDPFIARFLFWGSIHVALATGALTPDQIERLEKLAPAGIDVAQAIRDISASPGLALQRFQEARRARRTKLNAGELHRIMMGLVEVSKRDGEVQAGELACLHQLAGELGLAPAAVDVMLAK